MKFVNYLGQPIDVSGHRPLTDMEIRLSEVPVTKGISVSGSGFVEDTQNELSSTEIIVKAVKFDDDLKAGSVVFVIDHDNEISANFAVLSRGKESCVELFDLDRELSKGAVTLLTKVFENASNELSSSEIIVKAVKFDDDLKAGSVVFVINQNYEITANFEIFTIGKETCFELFDLDRKLTKGAVTLLAKVFENSCASAEAYCLHFDEYK